MPPSSETSTPPTRPPPASVAVPWMVTVVPGVTVVPRGRRDDRRRRRRRVGGGRGGGQARIERPGLAVHVGEEVDRRLLHAGVGGRGVAVVVGVEAPGPLDGAGAEDQRARWSRAVERQAVRRAAVAVRRAVVLQDVQAALGGRRQVDEPGRARAVVEVGVPLVAQRAVREGRLGAGRQVGDARVAPEAQLAGVGRDADRAGARVDHEDRARERVLGLGARGLNERASRQVPVHSPEGSTWAFSWVSL